MSRAAIFSFLPILTKLLPESVTKIEKGRYYRNRFHEISEKWIREHRQEYRGNRTGDLQVGKPFFFLKWTFYLEPRHRVYF
jgi:hypothetical protein